MHDPAHDWPPKALPHGCRSHLRSVKNVFEAHQAEMEMLVEQLGGMVARRRLRASAASTAVMVALVRGERRRFAAALALRWNALAILREAQAEEAHTKQARRQRVEQQRLRQQHRSTDHATLG